MPEKQIPMHRHVYGKRALKLPPLAAFDIETKGLGGDFILGAIVTSDGKRSLYDSLDAMLDFMLHNPQYRYLAHNACGYEFAYLAPLLYDYFQTHDVEIQPTLQGDSRIVQIRIYPDKENKKLCIDLRDTLCLFAMSLKKVANAFCPDLPKLTGNIDFEKVVFDPGNSLHIDYLWRDCDIIIAAYSKLASQLVDLFGSPLSVTAGSTALKAFYTTIKEGYVYYRLRKPVEDFIRNAYYGGCVLPGHHIGNWGKVGSVDINGAYAYQMKEHKYPVGQPTHVHYYKEGYLGFYRVLATVPIENFTRYGFNPVPKRTSSGLCWPSGTFETYLSSIEIDFAGTMGCSFHVLDGYYFTRSEYIFKDFVDKCQELELANNGAYKPTIKILRNACYGKFGTKTEHKRLIFSKTFLAPENGYTSIMDERSIPKAIPGLYTTSETSDADYIMPHLAALITAHQRVYLMGYIKKAYERGAEDVYCDTDSLKFNYHILTDMVKESEIPIGNTYGTFKTEEICEQFIVLGAKCFAGVTEEGKHVYKAKGVNTRVLTLKVYEDALKHQFDKNEFPAVDSPLTLLKKRAIVKPEIRRRRITDIRNSYAWKVSQEGVICPLSFSESYDTIYQQFSLLSVHQTPIAQPSILQILQEGQSNYCAGVAEKST